MDSRLHIIHPPLLQDMPIPERKWLLKEWIPEASVTALYGDGGAGKSLLAQQLMTSCALGHTFMGLETKKCRVFGVFCEDSEDELHRRQAAILQYHNQEFVHLENIQYVSRVGDDNLLITFENSGLAKLTNFFTQIENAGREFGAELIVIDTAADTFGGNENIRPQVRQYISACLGRLAKSCNATILFCAHPSVAGMKSDDGSGGSTAWSNSVRSRLYLSRVKTDKDEDTPNPDDELNRIRTLTKKKANYSTIGDEITLEYINGVLVKKYDSALSIVDSIAANNKAKLAEKAFMKALDNFTEQGRKVSDSKHGKYAPRLLKSDPACSGFTERDLLGAMNRLFSQGRIKIEDYGKKGNGTKAIVRVQV